MPIPTDRLYLAARNVLDVVVAYYTSEVVELPDRQYVSDGPAVAWDCEQCVVYVESTFAGLSDQELPQAQDAPFVRSARMQVEVVRCTPVVDDDPVEWPDPAAIEANAQLVLADAVLIPNAIRAAHKAGDLAGCNGVVLDQWQALGPLGGLVGGRLGLRYQLTQV